MKKIILNHKSYLLYNEIINFKSNLDKINIENVNLILFPQICYLVLFKNTNYFIGSQNFYSGGCGSFSGEINLDSLRSLNINYTMVNQYERFKFIGEEKRIIKEKFLKSVNNKFKTLLFINDNKCKYSLKKEINYFLTSVDKLLLKNVSIVYEPKYCLNTLNENDIKYISNTIKRIKTYVKNRYNCNMEVYYSGEISENNFKDIITKCDGLVLNKKSTDIEYIKNTLLLLN